MTLREKTLFKLIKDLKASAAKCTCDKNNTSSQPNAAMRQTEPDNSKPAGNAMPAPAAEAVDWALAKLARKRDGIVDLSSDIVANMTGQYHELLLHSTEQLHVQLETIAAQYWSKASRKRSAQASVADKQTVAEVGVGDDPRSAVQAGSAGQPMISFTERRLLDEQRSAQLRRALSAHIGDLGFAGKAHLHASLSRRQNLVTAKMMESIVSSHSFKEFLQKFATESLRRHENLIVPGETFAPPVRDRDKTTHWRRTIIGAVSSCSALDGMPANVKFACGTSLWNAVTRAERLYWSRRRHYDDTAADISEQLMLLLPSTMWMELFSACNGKQQKAARAADHVTDSVEAMILENLAKDSAWSLRVVSLQQQLWKSERRVSRLLRQLRDTEELALQLGSHWDSHRHARDESGGSSQHFRRGATAIFESLREGVDAVFESAACQISERHVVPRRQESHTTATTTDVQPEPNLRLTREALFAAMNAVYSKFNPRLRKRVPSILDEYEGKFHDLYERLSRKYGTPFTAALRSTPRTKDDGW